VRLEARDCRLPKDELLIAELATVRYSFTSNGKIQIEGKDDIRKRGLASPDKADAFCLTFASDAVIGMMGSKASTKWSQPLKRNLSRVA
jgi:phage terminase large subunit